LPDSALDIVHSIPERSKLPHLKKFENGNKSTYSLFTNLHSITKIKVNDITGVVINKGQHFGAVHDHSAVALVCSSDDELVVCRFSLQ
jgi:hypothetical protein